MGKRIVVESGRDRRALVQDAGWKRLSLGSLLAGVLVAYGAFAVLAAIAGGVLEATDADIDLGARWNDLGVAAGLVVAGLLFLSYLFGGYSAGRMARRAGSLHGGGTFVLGVLVAAGVAVLVRQTAGTDAVVENLRNLGLPTTGDEWRDVGTVAGLASLAAMLVGAVLGGILGERWHAKLLSRAVDPDLGAEADAHRQAAKTAAQAQVRSTTAEARVDNASLRHRHQPDDRPLGTDRERADDRPLGTDRERADDRLTAGPDDGTDRERADDRLKAGPDDGTGATARSRTGGVDDGDNAERTRADRLADPDDHPRANGHGFRLRR